jgi:GCN5-like protein 1 (GCN5L1)
MDVDERGGDNNGTENIAPQQAAPSATTTHSAQPSTTLSEPRSHTVTTATNASSLPSPSSLNAPPPPQAQTTTDPFPSDREQTAEARAALLSTLTNVGTSATVPLQQRASDILSNAAAIAAQEAAVQKATKDLAKQTAEYAKLADDARGKLKELGDVQNWAEVLERDLLVLEETMRMVDEEGLIPDEGEAGEDDPGAAGGDGAAGGKHKAKGAAAGGGGWGGWWRGGQGGKGDGS